MDTITRIFCTDAARHIREQSGRIETCVSLLTHAQLWQQPNPATNAVANLILHLCGNVTQYILSGLGGLPDKRQRHLEFSTRGGLDKAALLQQLHQVVAAACVVMEQQDAASLTQVRTVQGFEKTGLAIMLHVAEHFSYHTAQIALLTKLMTNADLGFYKGLDLNRTNHSN